MISHFFSQISRKIVTTSIVAAVFRDSFFQKARSFKEDSSLSRFFGFKSQSQFGVETQRRQKSSRSLFSCLGVCCDFLYVTTTFSLNVVDSGGDNV